MNNFVLTAGDTGPLKANNTLILVTENSEIADHIPFIMECQTAISSRIELRCQTSRYESSLFADPLPMKKRTV